LPQLALALAQTVALLSGVQQTPSLHTWPLEQLLEQLSVPPQPSATLLPHCWPQVFGVQPH
jgi:hypothetical protein